VSALSSMVVSEARRDFFLRTFFSSLTILSSCVILLCLNTYQVPPPCSSFLQCLCSMRLLLIVFLFVFGIFLHSLPYFSSLFLTSFTFSPLHFFPFCLCLFCFNLALLFSSVHMETVHMQCTRYYFDVCILTYIYIQNLKFT